MMKRRFKKVMNYFFNFDSKTPNKRSKKVAAPGSSNEAHLLNESQYIIRRLNEGTVTPRDNVSFSRYTPLPRIGEVAEQVAEKPPSHPMTSNVETPTSHILTYKFSPVQVRSKVSYQLTPLPAKPNNDETNRTGPTENRPQRPRLVRQNTYIVKEPVFIKGTLLEYLRRNDNMCTTRVHAPRSPHTLSRSSHAPARTSSNGSARKRSVAKSKRDVARASNSKQRLNEIKAKFKRQQEELKAAGQQDQAFWLEL